MSRGVLRLDRLVVLLVGLGLVALGLVLVDWTYGEVLTLNDTLDTSGVVDVMDSGWWPWAFAAGGLLIGLLGGWWLLAHLGRRGPSTLRLRSSAPSGRLEADVQAVASAAAQRLESLAPVVSARGTCRTLGSRTLVVIRGRVDAAADQTTLTEAAETCAADIAAAFPDDDVSCRIVLDAPQRPRTGRTSRVRVR